MKKINFPPKKLDNGQTSIYSLNDNNNSASKTKMKDLNNQLFLEQNKLLNRIKNTKYLLKNSDEMIKFKKYTISIR